MHNENGSVEEKEDVELKRKYKKKQEGNYEVELQV